ncbi:TolA protein [Cupriavidus necator]
MSAVQDVAREERTAARLEAERLKAEARTARAYAREDARAAAKFERGQPTRSASKRKTLANEKRKLVSYADLLRIRG